MANLEEIKRGARVKGILPHSVVQIIDVKWHGASVLEITYKDEDGTLGTELIYPDRAKDLKIISGGHSWSFDADGGLLRLTSEAYRIRLAYLFDPYLAVHSSLVEPLPHQTAGVKVVVSVP